MAKKRQEDFAKVKVKVGKKKLQSNQTNLTFKTRKIILKEAKHLGNDPITALLGKGNEMTTQLKLLRLTKAYEGIASTQPHNLTAEFLNCVARLCTDFDEKVRAEAAKNVSRGIDVLQKNGVDVDPSIILILTHVKCGLTHLNPNLVQDARKLLVVLAEKSSSKIKNHFWGTLLVRVDGINTIESRDLDVIMQVVEKLDMYCPPSANSGDRIERQKGPIIKHASSNGYIPLQLLSYCPPVSYIDLSFRNSTLNQTEVQFKNVLTSLLQQEITTMKNTSGEVWTLRYEEVNKMLNLVKLWVGFLFKPLELTSCPTVECVADFGKGAKHVAKHKLVTNELNRFLQTHVKTIEQ